MHKPNQSPDDWNAIESDWSWKLVSLGKNICRTFTGWNFIGWLPNSNPNINLGMNLEEPQNLKPIGFESGSIVLEMRIPLRTIKVALSFNSTSFTLLNKREYNIQIAAHNDKLQSFDQIFWSVGSYQHNLGDVVHSHKVNSLADLMGMKSTLDVSPMNGDRTSRVLDSRVL